MARWSRQSSRLLKALSESFDEVQDERREVMIKKIPFMLRFSKHSVAFFSKLLP